MGELLLLSFLIVIYFNARKSLSISLFLKVVVTILIMWGALIILRGEWNGSRTALMLNVIGHNGVILYLLPLLVFLPLSGFTLHKILYLLFLYSLFIYPLWLLNIQDLIQRGSFSYRTETIGVFLAFLSGFLLFFHPIFTKGQNLAIRITLLIYLVLMLINARRNICFSIITLLFLAYLVNSFIVKKEAIYSNILAFGGVLILILIILINLNSLLSGFFSYLGERGTTDTRSGVEELFFYDFNRSGINDWLFGRGLNGTYYQEMVDSDTGEITTDRGGIETGYLDLVLKGGILYNILLLVILIPAIVKGLGSRKMVGVSCGLFLLTYLVDLYTTSPLSSVSIRSILFYLCISVCYRKVRYIGYRDLKRLKYRYDKKLKNKIYMKIR
ncbi:hypothetical protein FXV77_06580 [Sphingobacterium phlebotomi]|uniref:O-antigen ligase-like membrane protein n=1 Tax=Sphingobacterium phlebotomi TaxID=2605433 RepID=A0A5D4HDF8_9SPHI|nr:hypothetical protein [Sphingobacterium phlebotomi]TYR36840.1 hypothetical protein FXV77_06580 [Sphingobacterium phlebotomi]